MTRKEAMDYNRRMDALRSAGISRKDAESLRRISMTLRRWYELECGLDGYCIVRGKWNAISKEFEYGDAGKPHYEYSSGMGRTRYHLIPDREAGALKRLNAIMARYPGLGYYIQGDPRGAPLYILRPGDVPAGGEVAAYYSRGLAVYK